MARKPTRWMLVTHREWWAVVTYVLALTLDGLFQESEDWQTLTNVALITASASAIYTLWTAPDRPRWRRLEDD